MYWTLRATLWISSNSARRVSSRFRNISEDAPLLVETTNDGAIVLRQAGVYPIETYSDARIREFEKMNTIPPAIESRVETYLRKKKKNR